MAGFLTTTILTSIISLLAVAVTVVFIPPSSVITIAVFLFLTLSFLYSISLLITYSLKKIYSRRLLDRLETFNSSKQVAAVTAVTVTVFFLLRILKAATLLNVLLLITIAILVIFYLKKTNAV